MSFPITAVGLKKSFENHVVLKNLSLTIKAGESMVIIGQSGTGKSVFLKCLLGFLPWDAGEVRVGPYEVGRQTPAQEQARFKESGVVFQTYGLFDSLTIWENIAFSRNECVKKRREHAIDLLEKVGLRSSVADLYPEDISGGMKRRVSIARAIALSPSYLFFDEPTEGLDPVFAHSISQLIHSTIRSLKATALTITHNLPSAFIIADQIALMDQGSILWQGTPQEMTLGSHPLVEKFLQGSQFPPQRT